MTLHNTVDRSSPGASVHGIFQARLLEWVAFLSVPTYKIIQKPKTLTSESWMGAWVTLIAADQIGPAIG